MLALEILVIVAVKRQGHGCCRAFSMQPSKWCPWACSDPRALRHPGPMERADNWTRPNCQSSGGTCLHAVHSAAKEVWYDFLVYTYLQTAEKSGLPHSTLQTDLKMLRR